MPKTLCDWTRKEIEKNFDELMALVAPTEYVCRKCARSARTSKVLCKPRRVGRELRGKELPTDETA